MIQVQANMIKNNFYFIFHIAFVERLILILSAI